MGAYPQTPPLSTAPKGLLRVTGGKTLSKYILPGLPQTADVKMVRCDEGSSISLCTLSLAVNLRGVTPKSRTRRHRRPSSAHCPLAALTRSPTSPTEEMTRLAKVQPPRKR